MASVTFYALTQSKQLADNSADTQEVDSELVMAAALLIEYVAARKKVTVLCATQKQAESFDDYIWQFPANNFIPHNLYGEGPDMGTPVEIIWHDAFLGMSKLRNTGVVLNLSQQYIDNIHIINHLVDFVPVEEEQKVQARERYKRYKQAGCQLEYKTA